MAIQPEPDLASTYDQAGASARRDYQQRSAKRLIAVPLILLAVLAGCGSSDGGGVNRELVIDLTVFENNAAVVRDDSALSAVEQMADSGDDFVAADCPFSPGYQDLRSGRITVRGGTGELIATGSLGGAVFTIKNKTRCSLSATLSVPAADFYSLEMGTRKPIVYSSDDLEALNWHLNLSLG